MVGGSLPYSSICRNIWRPILFHHWGLPKSLFPYMWMVVVACRFSFLCIWLPILGISPPTISDPAPSYMDMDWTSNTFCLLVYLFSPVPFLTPWYFYPLSRWCFWWVPPVLWSALTTLFNVDITSSIILYSMKLDSLVDLVWQDLVVIISIVIKYYYLFQMGV